MKTQHFHHVIAFYLIFAFSSCENSAKMSTSPLPPDVLTDSSAEFIIERVLEHVMRPLVQEDSIYLYPYDINKRGSFVDSRNRLLFGEGKYFQKKTIDTEGLLSVKGDLSIVNSIVKDNIIFGADTSSYLSCKRVVFYKKVFFGDYPPLRSLTLDRCYLLQQLVFGADDLVNSGIFPGEYRTSYSTNISILGSIFCEMPNFDRAEFDSSFSLAGSKFYCDSLIFPKTQFKYAPDFSFTDLPKYIKFIDLNNSKWLSPLDLTTAKFNSSDSSLRSKCVIYFACSDGFNPSYLDGRNFIIPSEKFEIQFDKNVSPTQQIEFLDRLARRCQELGDIESHKDWEIQKKKIHTNFQWPTIGPTINFLEQYLWFFGYSPVLLIYWMALIFLAFWVVNYLNIETLLRNTYHDKSLGESFQLIVIEPFSADSNLLFRTRGERISYAFIFTASIYFGFRINHEAINYRNGKGMAYIYFMYVSGTAHLALAFALLVK